MKTVKGEEYFLQGRGSTGNSAQLNIEAEKNARDQLQFEADSCVPVLYACMHTTWERTATGNPFRSTNPVNVNYSSFLETVTLVSLWKETVQTDTE